MTKIIKMGIVITFIINLIVIPPQIASAEIVTGSLGTNISFSLDTITGHMSITGTGAMTNYISSATRPFYTYKDDVKTVSIANGVTSIGNYAFRECISLTSVTIPNSVISIGLHAFNGCTSLTSVTIPDSVTSIESYAFNYCSNLTSVVIPNSVTSIGSGAFSWCANLTSATIPNSVTSIGERVFSYCPSLTSVTIPNSVTSIGYYAFQNCTNLTSVVIPNSVTSIGESAFRACTSLTSITIPNSVTSIGELVFDGCTSLTSVTIPNSVTSIGSFAFRGCTNLTSVVIPSSVTNIGNNAFNLTPQYYISATAPTTGTNNHATRIFGWTPLTITQVAGDADNVQIAVDEVNPLVSMKYAQGTRNAAYFASGGTEFSGTSLTLADGTYTFYTLDIGGNETVQTYTVYTKGSIKVVVKNNVTGALIYQANVSIKKS